MAQAAGFPAQAPRSKAVVVGSALFALVVVAGGVVAIVRSSGDVAAPPAQEVATSSPRAHGRIVFEVTGKGLFVAPAAGGLPKSATGTHEHVPTPASGTSEVRSPDGKSTAIVQRLPEGVFLAVASGSAPARQIAQLAAPGDPQLVAGGKGHARAVEGVPLVVAWSPDSKTLAYGSVSGVPWSLTLLTMEMATAGLGLERYYEVSGGYVGELAWSPDGRFLAISTYTIARTQHSVLMLDVAGRGTPVRLLDGCHITWSPDSRFVAVHRDPGPEGGAWVVTADGASRWLLNGEQQAFPLSWEG